MKIVINKCYGGFGLSYEAVMLYAKLKKMKLYAFVSEVGQGGNILYIPYTKEMETNHLVIHYSTKPLKNNKLSDEEYFSDFSIERTDPILIEVVEKLGSNKASNSLSKLAVVEIPDGVSYEINEYDGIESIHETHQVWG